MKKYIYFAHGFGGKEQDDIEREGHKFFRCNCGGDYNNLVVSYVRDLINCEDCGKERNYEKFLSLKCNNPKGFMQVVL